MKPRPYQEIGVKRMLETPKHLLVAPTGSGKTFMMKMLVTSLKKDDNLYASRNVLILCPTVALVDQTMKVMKSFNPTKFTTIDKILSGVVVSTWQSMIKAVESPYISKLVEHFDVTIVDEHHHSGETKLKDIVVGLNTMYFYGFTATPFRHEDTEMIHKLCDNNQHTIQVEDLYKDGYLVRPTVRFIDTNRDYRNFLSAFSNGSNWSNEQKLGKLKSIIGSDEIRNKLLSTSIKENKRKYTLVLSYTIDQTKVLYEMSAHENKYLIHGQETKKNKDKFFKDIEDDNKEFIIFATQSFLGEGIDIPKLDTLFLTTPFGGGAKAIQFIGRILRPYEGKKDVYVYDYVDKLSLGEYWEKARKQKYDTMHAKYDFGLRKSINEFEEETTEKLEQRWNKLEMFFIEGKFKTYSLKEKRIVITRGLKLKDELEKRMAQPYFCEDLYRADQVTRVEEEFNGRII